MNSFGKLMRLIYIILLPAVVMLSVGCTPQEDSSSDGSAASVAVVSSTATEGGSNGLRPDKDGETGYGTFVPIP